MPNSDRAAYLKAYDAKRKAEGRLRTPEDYRRYYAENREAILARAKARRSGERGDHMRAVQRAYVRKNSAQIVARMRERGYKHQKAWKSKNLLKLREYTQRRNALERSTAVGKVDYEQIYRESGGRCGICCQPIRVYDEIHFDHIVPLSRGGPHIQSNIQVAHARCNLVKQAKVVAA